MAPKEDTVKSDIFARVSFTETSLMRGFVKIKPLHNGEITLRQPFIDVGNSREFLKCQICLNAIRENKILVKISEFTVHRTQTHTCKQEFDKKNKATSSLFLSGIIRKLERRQELYPTKRNAYGTTYNKQLRSFGERVANLTYHENRTEELGDCYFIIKACILKALLGIHPFLGF